MNKKSLNLIGEALIIGIIINLTYYQFADFRNEYFLMNIHPLVIFVSIQTNRYGLKKAFPSLCVALICILIPFLREEYKLADLLYLFRYNKFFIMIILSYLVFGVEKELYYRKRVVLESEIEAIKHDKKEIYYYNKKISSLIEILKEKISKSQSGIINLHYLEKRIYKKGFENSSDEIKKIFNYFFYADFVEILKIKNMEKSLLERQNIKNCIEEKSIKEVIREEKREYYLPLIKNNEVIYIIHIGKIKYEHRNESQVEKLKIFSKKIQGFIS